MTTKFSYTIYDGHEGQPVQLWPSHDDVPLEATDLEEAVAEVMAVIESCDLYAADGYDVGAEIITHIWDADGRVARTVRHQITEVV